MMMSCVAFVCNNPSLLLGCCSPLLLQHNLKTTPTNTTTKQQISKGTTRRNRKRRGMIVCVVDPWAPSMDSQSIASQLFAVSLFPYLAFLYFITKSNSSPKLTLFGFYFLLAFVGATIPAGIYAKVHYGTSLSNVDWLHGGAESLLTLTNLFIVLGLRKALREIKNGEESTSGGASDTKDERKPSV